MEAKEQMGKITQLAYNYIAEDCRKMDEESALGPEKILMFLENGNNFKRLSFLLKETMIKAGIPAGTSKKLENYTTVSSFLCDVKAGVFKDSVLSDSAPANLFSNALFALLSRQEEECLYEKRKHNWKRPTIDRWLDEEQSKQKPQSGNSTSISKREDAIAICFALGLDYEASRDFLNKSGHAILNIRNHEDAVYFYCLVNHRPLSIAKELIHRYMESLDSLSNSEVNNLVHTGNTTLLLQNQILKNSNWETDDDFFQTFMLPNRGNFISYSRTALREYHKVKNRIYLNVLEEIMDSEQASLEFETKLIFDHICQALNDRKEDNPYYDVAKKEYKEVVPARDVQVSLNFKNKLPKYSVQSELLKEANEMLEICIKRIPKLEKKWTIDNFKANQNSLEVMKYIKNNTSKYANDENEQRILSDFLSDTVTAYRMFVTMFPSITPIDKDEKDSRQRKYGSSTLKNTVLRLFPQRQFFTLYEKHPEKFVRKLTLRKAIILLFYIDYASNLVQPLEKSGIKDETTFGFANFYEETNEILGKCQLGKLYYANAFDWLILESIRKLEINIDENDEDDKDAEDNPAYYFLAEVLGCSYGDKIDS